MLKLKYLFENYDLAREALALYNHDEESLEEMLSYFRISSNAIYPFFVDEEKEDVAFLRLSPAEEKTFEHVKSEVELICWLNEQGFLAMKPVAMKTGELVKEIQTKWGTYNVSCFENVPGMALDDVEGTLSIVRGYGKTLGKLHALMKNYPNDASHATHKELLAEIKERLEENAASDVVKAEYQAVCEALEKLPVSKDCYGVIHYDFEPDNVFYDELADAFHVIDFDDAIGCWYALDIVRAIDGLDDVVKEEELAEAEAAFLEGYESATTLTREQKDSFALMRRLVRLQEYATIKYVLSEPVEEKPDWMNAIIEKLSHKAECMEKAMEK